MATPSGAAFVALAATFLGTPYQWGGDSPTGFDCSGLVYYTLGKLGISAPRTSEAQWAWVQHIPQSELQPGDLVFENWPGEASPGHVAIYAGNNQIIEAPAPGQDVHRVAWTPGDITASGGTVVGYGRIPGLSASSTATLTSFSIPGSGLAADVGQIADIASSLEAFYSAVTDAKMWKSLGWLLLGVLFLTAGIMLWLRIPQRAAHIGATTARAVI